MQYPFLHQWDPTRYQRSWLLAKPSEQYVQNEILKLLRGYKVFVYAVDAGEKRMRGKAIRALQSSGADPSHFKNANCWGYDAPSGLSDISGVLSPGVPFYIEVKRPSGRPTQKQLDFLNRAYRYGARVGIAWHPMDAIEILGGFPALKANVRVQNEYDNPMVMNHFK